MIIKTNLIDFEQALRDNFNGVYNKEYISNSIKRHYDLGLITIEQYNRLRQEY